MALTRQFTDMIEDRKTGERLSEQLAENTKKTPWKSTNVYTSTEIQTIIDNAVSGDTIVLPSGRYSVTSQISWSDKELHIVGIGNVVFVESSPLTVPLIQATRAHKSTIKGIRCEGAETLASFSGTSAKHYSFIKLISTDKARIYDPVVTNKSYGVILENCNKCQIYNLDLTGFLVTGSLAENGANYSSGVYILGGSKNSVHHPVVKDVGSMSLIASDGKNHLVTGGNGENLRDNGVYVSSGTGCKVHNVSIDGVISSGVKTRGSNHSISGCNIINAFVGYTLTGNGTTADSLGYNGYGTICEGNIAENCSRMGLEIGVQDGYYPRDFKVLNNNFINCGESGSTYAPIKLNQGAGHQVKGNTIDLSPSDFGILLTATSTDKCKRYDVSQNIVRGNGITPKYGIRALYVDNSQLNKNIFESLSVDGVDCRYVTNSIIDGNSYPSGLVVNLTTTYQSSGNIVTNNIGSNIGLDLTQNTGYGNKPDYKNYHTSISAIPYAAGQKALVGGILYEAIGTSAISDWKQIS